MGTSLFFPEERVARDYLRTPTKEIFQSVTLLTGNFCEVHDLPPSVVRRTGPFNPTAQASSRLTP